jgi:hypothetical protein
VFQKIMNADLPHSTTPMSEQSIIKPDVLLPGLGSAL